MAYESEKKKGNMGHGHVFVYTTNRTSHMNRHRFSSFACELSAMCYRLLSCPHFVDKNQNSSYKLNNT